MTAKRTTKSLGIVDLLVLRGFDPTRPAKLVRRQSARYDVHELMRRGRFEYYQATQKRPVFDRCERIVSFVGTEGTKARQSGDWTQCHLIRAFPDHRITCVKSEDRA